MEYEILDNEHRMPPFAPVIISLFKGVLTGAKTETWKLLVQYETDIKKYFSIVGLEVYIDHVEKFAFLKEKDLFEEEEENYPRLIEKRPVSYPVTLLCVLLRKRLLEADAAGGETRVILNRDQIIHMLKIFLPESTNETRIITNIDSYINKVLDYGFLRRLKSSEDQDVYEINRVLIARVRADELQYIEGKLKEHARSIA